MKNAGRILDFPITFLSPIWKHNMLHVSNNNFLKHKSSFSSYRIKAWFDRSKMRNLCKINGHLSDAKGWENSLENYCMTRLLFHWLKNIMLRFPPLQLHKSNFELSYGYGDFTSASIDFSLWNVSWNRRKVREEISSTATAAAAPSSSML